MPALTPSFLPPPPEVVTSPSAFSPSKNSTSPDADSQKHLTSGRYGHTARGWISKAITCASDAVYEFGGAHYPRRHGRQPCSCTPWACPLSQESSPLVRPTVVFLYITGCGIHLLCCLFQPRCTARAHLDKCVIYIPRGEGQRSVQR